MPTDAAAPKTKTPWASVVWTFALVVLGFLFAVVFPYRAVVQNHLLFWFIVAGGLVAGFICAASELAFALWAGEGPTSEAFRRNTRENRRLTRISLDTRAIPEAREAADRKIQRLSLPIKIGADYSTIYNPTLVVTNAIANIVVAVGSGTVLFDPAQMERTGRDCGFAKEWLRCLDIFSFWIPVPVNTELFQSTMALTLILIVGEIIPKQLATSFPERVTRILFPVFPLLALLSLGTSPAFGAFGRLIAALSHRFSSNAAAGAANERTDLDFTAIGRTARTIMCAYSGGGTPLADWDNADPLEREQIIQATRGAIGGANPAELHNSWCDGLHQAGWRLGPDINPDQKTHPDLKPYVDLSPVQQTRLEIFVAAVRAIEKHGNDEETDHA